MTYSKIDFSKRGCCSVLRCAMPNDTDPLQHNQSCHSLVCAGALHVADEQDATGRLRYVEPQAERRRKCAPHRQFAGCRLFDLVPMYNEAAVIGSRF